MSAADKMQTWNEQEIERLRKRADHQDRLAAAADKEGDSWDAAACRAKANEYRREARRLENRP